MKKKMLMMRKTTNGLRMKVKIMMMKTKMKVIMVLTINRTIMKTASWMKNMPLKNKRTVTFPKN